uniref:BPTI/Kunitz inhibitor domain-containing protein n=1 Tax=Xiphophorus couchianus TaxID=32473 RepID=A0A3B5LSI8_9TELE
PCHLIAIVFRVLTLNYICSLPSETGPCRAYFPRWYFDVERHDCLPFVYGGCRGNENNFDSWFHCINMCGRLLFCWLTASFFCLPDVR